MNLCRVLAKNISPVSLWGELRTFYDFLLIVVFRWDTVRSWQVGPHRHCSSSAFSPGSGGLVLWCGSSPPHPCFSVFVRGLRELDKRLKGIAPFGGKQISGVEAESGKALSPGSFQIPCDHASEFIDLGKVVFFLFCFFKLN